jgi:predicted DCC family thiol-disulfide oxidoreductase YuxK
MESSPKNHKTDYAIVLFDGYCNFCSNSVRFINQRDHQNYFRFTGLESEKGKKLLKEYANGQGSFNSVVLIEGNQVYSKSTAALRIARKLSGLWPLFYIFILIPTGIRNAVYQLIAKNRYRWFGKKESCFIPSKELKQKFL